MGIPAVKWGKQTAGRLTELTRKYLMTFGAGIAIFTLCAFSPATEVKAQSPFEQVTKTVTVTEKIPFETTYIDLPNLYRGFEELVSEGVMGAREIQAQVVYEGETPVKVLSIKSNDTGQPVNQVIRRGTKLLKSETADGSRWKTSFIRPIKTGWVSADLYDYRGHTGVDFAAPSGTPVYASAQGTVTMAAWYGEYGRCVILTHADGTQTLYAHNSSLLVSTGQKVKQGEAIARVGTTGNSTGNHLHFEIRVGDSYLDPMIYIGK